ncbi:MAG: preprotein translocase subunit SecE [bacterium]
MTKINQLVQYLKDSKDEIKKVSWPTKKEIRQHTLLVIGISIGVALFLGACDYVLTLGLQKII